MRESALHAAVFEHASMGIMVVNASGIIIKTNPFLQRLFGYSARELLKKPVEILLPYSLREIHQNHRKHYYEGPKFRPMDMGLALYGRKKDGSKFPVEISLGHFLAEGETLVIAFVTDATHQKKNLKILRENQARLEEAQALLHLGSLDWDIKHDQVLWSDEVYRILGLEPKSSELSLEGYYECIHPADRAMVKAKIIDMLREKAPINFEYRIKRPDSSIRHLKDRREINLDKDGKIARIYGLIQDITNLREKSIALAVKDKAISQSATPFAFTSMDGTITNVNRAFVKLWGYDSEEEIVGKNNSELSNTEAEISRIMQSVARSGSWSGEARAIKKNGTCFDIFLSSNAIYDEDGQPQSLMASFADISKLKEAEAINRDISKIVEDSLNEIYIFDASSLKFIQINKGGRLNIGYSLEELRVLTPVDIKPEYTQDSFLKLVEPLLNGDEEKIQFETVHQRKDGSTYAVDIHLQLSTLGDRPVFVAIVLDITERKEAEKELQELNFHLEKKVATRTQELSDNQAKLKEANQLAKIGHWEIDVQNQSQIFWSEEYYQLYEVDNKTTVDNPRFFLQFVHTEDQDKVLSMTKNAIRNGEDVIFVYRIKTPTGKKKYLRAMVSCQKKLGGEVKKIFTVVQDISDQKVAEGKLQKALHKERELSKLKSRFVSMASHEFRTPLTSILSSSDLIKMHGQRGNQDMQQKHLDRIKSSVHNLTTILNDFLSLEKLESGKIASSPEELDLHEFISEVCEEVHLIAKPNQQISHTHQGAAIANIDRHLLKNILLNLLSNAIKYSPSGEDVALITEIKNGLLILKVVDHGIGIPFDDQEQMFTRFFRASNAIAIQGTGLGLTIVKRYLDLMNGQITFTSSPNQGTAFNVRIPV